MLYSTRSPWTRSILQLPRITRKAKLCILILPPVPNSNIKILCVRIVILMVETGVDRMAYKSVPNAQDIRVTKSAEVRCFLK